MTDKQARYLRVTFPDQEKIVLTVGPGDHTVDRWEISLEQLRGLILDGLPKVLIK